MRIAGRNRGLAGSARRADRRNRVLLAAGRVVAVFTVVLTFLLVTASSKAGTVPLASTGPAGAALASVVKDVTGTR